MALGLAAAGCTGAGETVTTTAATVPTTTSTTIDLRLCENLADDAVRWVEDLVAELLHGVDHVTFALDVLVFLVRQAVNIVRGHQILVHENHNPEFLHTACQPDPRYRHRMV